MIASKVLLLGESPAAGTEGRSETWLAPGSSPSADRLLKFTGYSADTYLDMFDRDNLLHYLPRRSGKGREFTYKIARRQVNRLFGEYWCPGQRIVMLGRRVASAFDWYRWDRVVGPISQSKLEYLKWYRIENRGMLIWAAVVPHPSGVNRWWNDANNRRRARKFFRELRS